MSAVLPLVAMSHARLLPSQAHLEHADWRLVKLWELTDAERLEVRAIFGVGEFVLERAVVESLPRLGLVATVSVGYDGVDVPWCRSRGIEVTHAKGLNAEDVADHALGLMLGAWRGIAVGDRFVREGRWRSDAYMTPPLSLTGRHIGIVGLGAIGQAVARRAEACGLKVSWWGPRPKDAPWPMAESLLALAEASDILVVASRADGANRGLITAEVIDAVGPEGLIVNVSRGALVDEPALIAALKAGRLGHAALDVFADEPTPPALWADVPNTLLTPHSAGATAGSVSKMVAQAVGNVRKFLAGEPVDSPV